MSGNRRPRFTLEIDGKVDPHADNTDDYEAFIRRLRHRLGERFSRNVPALAVQSNPPPGFADVIIQVDTVRVRFRLRNDNLYLIGFERRNKDWYEFEGSSLIGGSKNVGFGCSYVSLSQAGPGIVETNIGRSYLETAIVNLDNTNDDDKDAKQTRAISLTVVIFMICEAARFAPVLAHMTRLSQGTSNESSKIPNWMLNLVRSWGNLCGFLWRLDADPEANPPAERFMLPENDRIDLPPGVQPDITQVQNIQHIVQVVALLLGLCYTQPPKTMSLASAVLLNNNNNDNNNTDKCFVGMPMLQLFSIEIKGSVGSNHTYDAIFGTITINNGLSTRTVYNRTKDKPEPLSTTNIYPNMPLDKPLAAFLETQIVLNLLLRFNDELIFTQTDNNSYRVDDEGLIIHSNNYNSYSSRLAHQGTLVSHTILWDAFNLGTPYDRLISVPLQGGASGSATVTARYAVMRDAMAATVFVNLAEASDSTSQVYGQIYAHYGDWGDADARIWLFDSPSRDYASVQTHANIPLLQSTVAVPLTATNLKITARLYDHNTIWSDELLVDQTFVFPIPHAFTGSTTLNGDKHRNNMVKIQVTWSSGL
ncbi:rRNA N-glycosidase [Striga asiatica]|uniref:rRNA N-glycosylase n=1 Tax=Striga asiatica TaxID=4170 RepID=A0A5A7P5D2_STRAF|nr:rRNA N-glycosidase [Striga asiatica]